MKLTSLARVMSITATAAILSSAIASANVVRTPMVNGGQRAAHAATFGNHGVRADLTCPSQYFECISVTAASPFSAGWCFSFSGNCSQSLTGPVQWSAAVTSAKKGKPSKKLTATWSPNPGNPSTVTITTKKKKAKGKKIAFNVSLSGCVVSTGTCLSDFVVYGVTN